jgi:hypothetical protein
LRIGLRVLVSDAPAGAGTASPQNVVVVVDGGVVVGTGRVVVVDGVVVVVVVGTGCVVVVVVVACVVEVVAVVVVLSPPRSTLTSTTPGSPQPLAPLPLNTSSRYTPDPGGFQENSAASRVLPAVSTMAAVWPLTSSRT